MGLTFHSPIIIGAIGGFAGALLVDLHTYSTSPEGASFSWSKAAARWVAGGIAGAMTGTGLSVAGA